MSYPASAQPQGPADSQAYYPQVPTAPGVAAPTSLAQTNAFSLVAVILGFIVPLAGIVFGHLALGQIKRTGEGGRGLALTGLIVGYAYFLLIAALIVLYLSVFAIMFASLGMAFGEFSGYSSEYY